MSTVAEPGGAGRARSGPGPKIPKRASDRPNPLAFVPCPACFGTGHQAGLARGDLCDDCHGDGRIIDWNNPLTKLLLGRVINWPSFYGPLKLSRAAVKVLGQLIDHRNRATGQCNPSRDVLGAGIQSAVETVSRGTRRLKAAGLIRKEQGRWRGWLGSNAYSLTPQFFELATRAHTVGPGCQNDRPPRAKKAGGRLSKRPTNGDPSVPSALDRGSKGEPTAATPGTSRRRGAPPTAPASRASHPPSLARNGGGGTPDPQFEAFLGLFASERFEHYGDHDTGTVGEQNQARITSFVAELTGEAKAWAEQNGIEADAVAIREDLSRRMIRLWLTMPGSTGALVDRRHPIGLLPGDLERIRGTVIGRWKTAQRKGAPLPSVDGLLKQAPPMEPGEQEPEDYEFEAGHVAAEDAPLSDEDQAALGHLRVAAAPQEGPAEAVIERTAPTPAPEAAERATAAPGPTAAHRKRPDPRITNDRDRDPKGFALGAAAILRALGGAETSPIGRPDRNLAPELKPDESAPNTEPGMPVAWEREPEEPSSDTCPDFALDLDLEAPVLELSETPPEAPPKPPNQNRRRRGRGTRSRHGIAPCVANSPRNAPPLREEPSRTAGTPRGLEVEDPSREAPPRPERYRTRTRTSMPGGSSSLLAWIPRRRAFWPWTQDAEEPDPSDEGPSGSGPPE